MWRVPGVVAGRPEQPSRQSNSPASLSLCVLAKGTNWGKTPLERPLLPSASQASSTVTTASVPLLAYTLAPLRQRHSLIGACCVTERRYVERFSSVSADTGVYTEYSALLLCMPSGDQVLSGIP